MLMPAAIMLLILPDDAADERCFCYAAAIVYDIFRRPPAINIAAMFAAAISLHMPFSPLSDGTLLALFSLPTLLAATPTAYFHFRQPCHAFFFFAQPPSRRRRYAFAMPLLFIFSSIS